MSSWDSNIYYHPEKHGLTVVLDVDKSDGCYQFDQFIIWKDEGGRYYWAEDAGCSCPSPFDGVSKDTMRQGSLEDAKADALAWVEPDLNNNWRYNAEYARAAHARIKEVLGA